MMKRRMDMMTPVEYFAPKSIEEAISLLSQYGEKAKVVSGGTDLLRQLKHEAAVPECLISLGGIHELEFIKYDEISGLRVGALTTIVNVANSSLIRGKFSILAQAAGMLGTPAVRNQATIGGNLCNAAPSADTAPALLVLGAMVKIAGIEGEKVIPIEDFFTGPGLTILGDGYILTEIQIPNLPPHSRGCYLKQTRRQGSDLAVVGVAALVVMEGEILRDVRIALGAVAPTPIRAKKAEGMLRGKKLDAKLVEETGQAASYESMPIDDLRGSADYRRRLVAVLTKRALTQAVLQVQSEVR
jgi:carbon-monoxide dehydrogenase medium subunit